MMHGQKNIKKKQNLRHSVANFRILEGKPDNLGGSEMQFMLCSNSIVY